jgi:hypothetical protein
LFLFAERRTSHDAARNPGLRPGAASAQEPASASAPAAKPACADAEACIALAAELDATDTDAATEAYYAACLHGHVDGCEREGVFSDALVAGVERDAVMTR